MFWFGKKMLMLFSSHNSFNYGVKQTNKKTIRVSDCSQNDQEVLSVATSPPQI